MTRIIQPGEGIGDFVQLKESLYTVLNRFKRSEAMNVIYSEKDYLHTPITVQLKLSGINLVFQKDHLVLIEINKFDTLHYAYNGVELTNLMNLKVIYNKLFGPTYPGKLINDSYLLSYPGVAFKFGIKDVDVDDNLSTEKILSFLLNLNQEIPCTSMFIFNDTSFGEFMSVFGKSKTTSASTISSLSSLESATALGTEAGFSLLLNAKMRFIKLRLHGKEFFVTIGKTSQQDILNFLGPPDDYFNKFDSRLLIHNSFFKQITSNELNRIYKFHNYFKYGVDFLYDLNNGGKLKKIILHNGNLIESNSFVHWNKCKYEIFLGNNSSAKNPFDAYDVRITSDMYFNQIPSEFFEGSDKTPILLNRNESELLDNDLDVISLDEVNHNWGLTKLYCAANCIWEVLNNDSVAPSKICSHREVETIMKLTSWVIDDAPKVVAPDKQFTLQLRKLGLTSVEDLGMTRDKFTAIDLTNNQLIEIGGFDKLAELKTLIANNNSELYMLETELVSNLESLCLMNCNFKLVEMKNFGELKHLKHLVLIGNPVENIQDYRLIMIYLMPSLATLDFQKVKHSERLQSAEKFGTILSPTSAVERLFTENDQPQISQEVKLKLIAELQNTNDINEIERIERILKSGNL